MPAKKATKAPRLIPAKRTARVTKSPRAWLALDRRVAVLGVICGMGAVGLMASRQLPPPARVITAPPEPAITRPADSNTRDLTLSAVPTLGLVTSTRVAPVTEAAMATETARATETAEAAESSATANDESAAPVTITGCLERGDETFWLKNATGAGTPTSRSWKSGFLKRRTPPIEVVDATNALRLSRYVGQRIAATGTLVDREMQTRTLRSVAASCG
jgi:hypothetical protein